MVDTHCPYCALQCAMTLTPTATGVEVRPREFPTNRGGLCQKGWTSASVLDVADRITTPLVRGGDGELSPASWDDALDLIVARLRDIWRRRGRDAVGVFGGGGLTNEKSYQLGKFARVALGTRYVDYNGRFCMSSAAAAGNRAFGLDRGLPFPLADLGGAQAALLVGSNMAETMPPAVQHLSGARAAGGLVVVDPRRTPTAMLAEGGAGLHLQPLPGTDLQLLLGILHVVWHSGLADETYLQTRVSGVETVRRCVAQWWPERVERETGVPVEQIRGAARLLAAAAPAHGGAGAYVLTGRGAEQHAHGTDTVTAAIDLALALGLPGVEGSGYGCITGQGNGQGGREHGQKSDQLPGYRMITDPPARAHVAGVWGIEPDAIPGPGVPAVALLDLLGRPGGLEALFVHGANLVVSAPDATAVTRRLRSLDLLVVCDFVPSETARLAHVVLPVTQWAEEDGTMTSLEGRILRRSKVVEPPEGVRSELEIWHDLAERLGAPSTFSPDPAAVLAELGRASAGARCDYSGVTPERAAAEALYWPVTGTGHDGTPRLFLDRFPTPDGRAVMHPVHATPVADDLRCDAELYLVTGRVLQHYQSGAQTRRVPELSGAPRGYLQLHPFTAERLGIEEGTDVRVTSSRGTCVVPARLSDDIRADTVFMPFHYAGAESANALTNPAVDPISGMPEFKVCAVDVAPADQDRFTGPLPSKAYA